MLEQQVKIITDALKAFMADWPNNEPDRITGESLLLIVETLPKLENRLATLEAVSCDSILPAIQKLDKETANDIDELSKRIADLEAQLNNLHGMIQDLQR